MNENWGTQRCDIYKKEFDVIMMQNVEKEAFKWPSLESLSFETFIWDKMNMTSIGQQI